MTTIPAITVHAHTNLVNGKTIAQVRAGETVLATLDYPTSYRPYEDEERAAADAAATAFGEVLLHLLNQPGLVPADAVDHRTTIAPLSTEV